MKFFSKAAIDIIVNYLVDISKIIFGGIIVSNIFVEKFISKNILIWGLIISFLFFLFALIIKNLEERI